MAYKALCHAVAPVDIPPKVRAFIDEADRRCEVFYDQQLNKRYPRYVPSEPDQVYAALHYVTESGLPYGNRFIELGSGFGVATGLAALLGYEATGIEIQEALVEMARGLIDDQGIDAEFICTSYVPEGYLLYDAVGGDDIIEDNSFGHHADASPCYGEMETPINEIDLFFAYPWPGEQEMMLKLFDAMAGEGAILIAYFGDQDICIYQKL